MNYPAFHTLYSYLIEYTTDLKPVPSLASAWQIAADNASVTITLRAANFSSGAAVTSADLVAGIKRAQDPTKGLTQANNGAAIASATASDDHTVVVKFNNPVPNSFITDWMYAFPVVEASKNDADTLQKAPAGCGPFVLDSYSPGVSLSLKKNPNYWGPGEPYLDGANFQFFQDQNSLTAALQSGSLDVAEFVQPSLVQQLKANYPLHQGSDGAVIGCIYVNTTMAPFDNKMVRQALARAVDRQRFVSQARYGISAPVYGIFPPGSPAYDENYDTKLAFNLDAAKTLLQQSGVSSLKGTVSLPSTDPVRLQEAQILQSDLKTIGFDLQIQTMEPTSFTSALGNGQLQLALSGTGSYPLSAANITDQRLAIAKNPLWKDGTPPQAWIDALKAAQSALTDAAAKAAYAQMNAVIADESWIVGTDLWLNAFLLSSRVKNFVTNYNDMCILTTTTID